MATGRIGTTPVLTTRWTKEPSAGTTSLSGLDANSVSLVYSVGYEQVYRNGVLLSRGNDYTATDGTTITLTDATIAGDIIEVFANATVPLTDTYTQTQANGKFINNTLTTTTGDIIYASAANTPARLGIGSTEQVLKVSGGIPAWGAAPAASFVGCKLFLPSAQSIANNTDTLLAFGAGSESIDTNGFHDTSTNNQRITIPSGYAGKYLVIASTTWASGSSGGNNRHIWIQKNTTGRVSEYLKGPDGTSNVSVATSVIVDLAVGDYVRAYVNQDSGGNLDAMGTNAWQTRFEAYLIGA